MQKIEDGAGVGVAGGEEGRGLEEVAAVGAWLVGGRTVPAGSNSWSMAGTATMKPGPASRAAARQMGAVTEKISEQSTMPG